MNNLEMEKFVDAGLTTYRSLFIEKINKNNLRSGIREEIEVLLGLNDRSIMEIRSKRFPICNTDADDFEEKVLDVDGLGKIIAGIRFKNLEIDKAFVSVYTNFEINNIQEIYKIIQSVKVNFKMFPFQDVMFKFAPEKMKIIEKLSISYGDHVVARLADEKKSDCADLSKIKLSYFPLDEFEETYEMYSRWYDEFHIDNFNLRDFVPKAAKESIKSSIKDQMAYLAHVNDIGPIGVVCGRKRNLLGANSAYISEMLLKKEFRGCGLSSLIQRKFLATVAANFDYQLVWGTIHNLNIPSLKCAKNNGREIIQTEVFIPLS